MSTDFFDDDLTGANRLKPNSNNEEKKITPVKIGLTSGSSRMVRQKEELTTQVAGAVSEIELLRRRQELLEKEKTDLEELARKQDEYEKGKRDIMEKLERSIILIDKEAERANQMIELLGIMRGRFEDALVELKRISEDNWSDDNFQIELNGALVLVEDAKKLYVKGLAKIDALSWNKGDGEDGSAVLKELPRGRGDAEKNLAFWVKMGMGITLPLIVVIVILFLVYLVMTSGLVW